ncbi:thiamine phosphate synthase [Nitrospirillum viridazoti]|uniref:Thiamine phosphate synthase n=1 Tax=Nitrospirillum viridazoti CBAmc TaxID=1441467 RepID=A0A248JSC2_9PROT|nr:thiamine phosphate synthase [Nitrospirillum amazonense]ASG21509.1 thiamine phosphate synthase [Nitrospirillum amazonense CBAmc]
MGLPNPPLLVITDRRQASMPLPRLLDRVFAAGCRWVSVREKDLAPCDRLDLVRELRPMARHHGALLTVHADLAAAVLCDGVHLGAGGDVAAARARLGPQALVGLSRHHPDEGRGGADYATLSPIFETASKPGYGPALGPQALSRLPGALALGGITPANAAQARAAGAAGLAVMGTVMRASDPAAVVRDLLVAWG